MIGRKGVGDDKSTVALVTEHQQAHTEIFPDETQRYSVAAMPSSAAVARRIQTWPSPATFSGTVDH